MVMGRHPDSRAVLCSMCGGKFFPASLPFHQKACSEKAASTYLPCPECNVEFPQATLRTHLQNCRNKRYAREGMFDRKSSTGRPRTSKKKESTTVYSHATGVPDGYGTPTRKKSGAGSSTIRSPGAVRVGTAPAKPATMHSQYSQSSMEHAGTSAAQGLEYFSSGDDGRVECGVCGRKFNIDRIAKHQSICQKTTTKRRPAFRSEKQRLEGEQALLARRTPKPSRPKTNWREKHRDFQQAVRAARQVDYYQKAGVPLSSLPPPTPSANPDYIPCPYCGRRYAPSVAERHIPACKNIINKPKPPPSVRAQAWSGGGGTSYIDNRRGPSSSGTRTRAAKGVAPDAARRATVRSAAQVSHGRGTMGSSRSHYEAPAFGSDMPRFDSRSPASYQRAPSGSGLLSTTPSARPVGGTRRFSVSDGKNMTIKDLMDNLDAMQVDYSDCCEKEELARRLAAASSAPQTTASSRVVSTAHHPGYGYEQSPRARMGSGYRGSASTRVSTAGGYSGSYAPTQEYRGHSRVDLLSTYGSSGNVRASMDGGLQGRNSGSYAMSGAALPSVMGSRSNVYSAQQRPAVSSIVTPTRNRARRHVHF